MTGTERQVAWAEEIVRQATRDVEAMTSNPDRRTMYQSRLTALVAAKAEAAWWIDHRSDFANLKRALLTRAERLGRVGVGQDTWTPADAFVA